MFLGFTETQKQQKTSRLVQKKRNRLFCRVCGKRISDMRYLTSVDGGSPNRVFRNPNGYLYEIITLSDCYVRDLDQALANDRAQGTPAVLKALSSSGANQTDLILSKSDADQLRGLADHLNFLREARVVIVLD